MSKLLKLVVASLEAGCYGEQRKSTTKEERKHILSQPNAFVQLNFRPVDGKITSLRLKASAVGNKSLGIIEKNIKAGSILEFDSLCKLEEVDVPNGTEKDGVTPKTRKINQVIGADQLSEDGTPHFAVVGHGPIFALPEGWEDDDEISEADTRYSIRKNGFMMNNDVEDSSKILAATAGITLP